MNKFTISVPKISSVLAVLFISFNVSPFVMSLGHPFRRGCYVFGCWLFTTLFWKPEVLRGVYLEFKKRRLELVLFAFWLAIVVANAVLQRGYTGDLHVANMLNLTMIVACGIYLSGLRDGSCEFVLKTVFVLIGIEVLISLPTLWDKAGIARSIMQAVTSEEEVNMARADSIGQYGYYTALAIIIPIYITRIIINKGLIKVVLLVMTFVVICAILISTFMGAVLLMLTGLLILGVLHVTVSFNKMKVVVGYLVVGLIFYLGWMVVLKESPHFSYVTDKITAQIAALSSHGLKGDVTERWELWVMSIGTFLENPLFGVGPVTHRENPILYVLVGGHASWFDQFYEYGLLFFCYLGFLFVAMLRLIKALNNKKSTKENQIAYYGQIVSGLLYFLCGLYNPTLFVLEIYVLFHFFSLQEHEKVGII